MAPAPANSKNADRMDTIVSLSKRRGFVFPSSEIYGGLRASWDYGPLGVELKNNVKRQWWQSMVQGRDDVVGLDSCVILAREVWEASGHVREFVDPLTECQSLPQAVPRRPPRRGVRGQARPRRRDGSGRDHLPELRHPGTFTEPKMFNGLLRTYLGPVEDESGLAYLRPETAQGIFINFLNVPAVGAAQAAVRHRARSASRFRNEITPGNFIFRTREFEQMEMEFFVEPGTDEKWHEYWIDSRLELVHRPRHRPGQPAALRAPEGEAVALLEAHRRHRVPLQLRRQRVGRARGHRQPHRLRPDDALASTPASTCPTSTRRRTSAGRRTSSSRRPASTGALLAFLLDAYTEDEAPNAKGGVEKRTVLRLDPRLAPVKAAVLPLSRNADLSPTAQGPRGDAAQALERRVRRRAARSAGATAARTRSARRSASPSTSTRSTTRP